MNRYTVRTDQQSIDDDVDPSLEIMKDKVLTTGFQGILLSGIQQLTIRFSTDKAPRIVYKVREIAITDIVSIYISQSVAIKAL